MREKILFRLKSHYLYDSDYTDYVNGSPDVRECHEQCMGALQRLNDDMLLALYTKILSGRNVIVVSADESGENANIYFPQMKYFGTMLSDGSTHT